MHILAGAVLGHDAFQLTLRRGFEQRLAVSDVMVGVMDEIARRQNRSQQCFALLQPRRHQIVAVKVQQVEDVVRHGNVVTGAADATAARANPSPLLHQAEGRPAVLVESDNLAVKNCGTRPDAVADGVQLGIGRSQIVLIA